MMDLAFQLFNAVACACITMALIGAVLSPKVHDGIVIKVGLSSMALGFGSLALRMFDITSPVDLSGLARSLLLINAGIAVVIVGYLVRHAKAGHSMRRITDWADLQTEIDSGYPPLRNHK